MLTDLDDTSAVDDSDADPDFIPTSCESSCSDYCESDVNKKGLRKHLNQRRLPLSSVLCKKINRNNTVAKRVNYSWNRSNLHISQCLKTIKAVNALKSTFVDFKKSYVSYDEHYSEDHSTVISSNSSVVSASTEFINKHSTSVAVSDTSGYCSAVDTESSYCSLNNINHSKRKKKMSSLSSIFLLPSIFMESYDGDDGDEDDVVNDNDSINISIDTDINVDRVMEVYDNRTFINSEIVEKFSDLNVEITWDLPQTHSDQNALRWDHNGLNETTNINSDRFTEYEDKIIARNWGIFKLMYGFEDPSLFFQGYLPKSIFTNVQKRKFVQFISRGIPDRTLRSVYNRFNILFASEFNSGRFSYREDRILLEMNKIPGNLVGGQKHKSKILQSILRRKGLTINRRWCTLKKTDPSLSKPLKWSLKFSSKLVRLLLRYTNCSNIEELNRADIPCYMWNDIACELKSGKLSGGRLKSYWLNQLSVQLSCKQPVYRNKLRSELIMWFHLRIDELHNWKEIKWTEVSEYFQLSPFFLYRKFRNMVMKYVPVVKIVNLRAMYCFRKRVNGSFFAAIFSTSSIH
ncbi:uncharacterized protein LOC142328614 isoform X3 [Lycorma delicatula]|uniref:uncharacterized protein LOC142328614 isoform X3 n=1 Tax=Lycorma delicatula TaxID=130591 RepID=UPI003F51070D